ncbi:MAG TPA: hypothetical protein VL970_12030, partial [Candidatus Acidoferrales bacterium]|nr:hypothetical protein [Candidatus Acidoferrales bacterium]
ENLTTRRFIPTSPELKKRKSEVVLLVEWHSQALAISAREKFHKLFLRSRRAVAKTRSLIWG